MSMEEGPPPPSAEEVKDELEEDDDDEEEEEEEEELDDEEELPSLSEVEYFTVYPSQSSSSSGTGDPKAVASRTITT